MLKKGDRVISTTICGLRTFAVEGNKGIIMEISNANGEDNEIYVKFDNIVGTKYCGTLDNPRVKLLKRIKKHIKPEDLIL